MKLHDGSNNFKAIKVSCFQSSSAKFYLTGESPNS